MLHHPEKYYGKKEWIEKNGSQSYMHARDQYFASKFYFEEENFVICRWALALWRSYTFEIHSQIKFRSAKTDLTVVIVQLQPPRLLTCRCSDVDLAPASLALKTQSTY